MEHLLLSGGEPFYGLRPRADLGPAEGTGPQQGIKAQLSRLLEQRNFHGLQYFRQQIADS